MWKTVEGDLSIAVEAALQGRVVEERRFSAASRAQNERGFSP